MSNLEKAGQDACAVALKSAGFVVKRRGLLIQPQEDKKVTGWLGLNLATWNLPSSLYVNPVVGIRHIPLEQEIVQLIGGPAPVACPTRPIGYLMPQNTFVQWEFHADSDLMVKAEEVAKAVADYGQPFIDKWSDWQTFSNEIGASGLLLDTERPFTLALVAAINRNISVAKNIVQEELERIGDAQDVRSKAYRDFAAKFAQRYI